MEKRFILYSIDQTKYYTGYSRGFMWVSDATQSRLFDSEEEVLRWIKDHPDDFGGWIEIKPIILT